MFNGNAKAETIEQTLRNLERNYTKLESFEAKITQELFHRESNSNEIRQGKVLFAKPENIILETTSPSAEFIIVNEQEIWHYLPEEEVAYRYNVTALENSQIALSILTGQNKILDNFEVEKLESEDNKNLEGFLLYPNEATSHLVEAQIWINPQTDLIEKLVVLDFFGNTNTISFNSFIPNIKFKKSDFTFTPPSDIDVEDRFEQ